jgi:aminoglycoside 3-N-acetyltransferase I
MEPPHVHRLLPDDLSLARDLNRLFGTAFDDPETYIGEPPPDDYISRLLAKEHVIVLAALSGDEVVGGLVAYELPKLERTRSEIYIYDLAVAERFRRKHIATALIDHVRGIARERGAWVIYVQADYGDEPAIRLYEKVGVREDVMHFDIPPN